MKLRIFALLITLFLLCSVSVCASMPDEIPAGRLLPRLTDDAGLLEDGEAAGLLAALDEISERQQVDVVIVTTDALPDGYTAQAYADDVFDYYGFGFGPDADGILLLLTMAEREWAVSTCGYGIPAFPDGIIDRIMDDCLYYISDGAYFSGFSCFAQLCDEYISMAKDGYRDDVYSDYSNDDAMAIIGGADGPTAVLVSGGIPFALPMSLIFGFIIAAMITGSWKNALKTVKKQSGASAYAKQDSINVTLSRDIFLYRTVRKVRRQTEQSNRSGGMSSTHRSSSGRTHGGRSGRF